MNSDEGNEGENSNQFEDFKGPGNIETSVVIPVDVNQDEEVVKDVLESKDEAESGNSSDNDGVQYPDTTVKIDFSAMGKGIEFIASRLDSSNKKVHKYCNEFSIFSACLFQKRHRVQRHNRKGSFC